MQPCANRHTTVIPRDFLQLVLCNERAANTAISVLAEIVEICQELAHGATTQVSYIETAPVIALCLPLSSALFFSLTESA